MSIGRQIRAARGLLKWSGATLAQHAGLTRDTINKIEDDAVQPREGTIRDILRAFDEAGVEFTDNFGVRLKPQGVEVLVGYEGLCKFFEGLHAYLQKHGGLVQVMGVDEAVFSEHMGAYEKVYADKMDKLLEERNDVLFQTIIKEGDYNAVCSNYADYRWVSEDLFEAVPFYVFGEHLAIISFQTVPSPTIVVHKIPAITQAYKKQFEAIWKKAQPVQEKE